MLLGYGEDALTLWVIQQHLDAFLQVLGDPTACDQATCFYRPSFGRRATKRGVPEPLKTRAEFGEFDAIVSTPTGIYLVESKWTASAEANNPMLQLSEPQLRRHAIMRCYVEEWQTCKPASWPDFLVRSNIRSRLQPFHAVPAGPATRLARNLKVVLGFVARNCVPVRDIVVFFRAEDEMAGGRFGSPPGLVGTPGFTLVGVDCRDVLSGGFLLIDRVASAPRMWVNAAPTPPPLPLA
jgi:hypothetical protein